MTGIPAITTDPFLTPSRTITVSEQWIGVLLGQFGYLDSAWKWSGTPEDVQIAVQNVRKILAYYGMEGELGLAIAIDSYTGTGNATQAVTGIGFQPKAVILIPHYNGFAVGFKTEDSGLYASVNSYWLTDEIISLDSDGFTVGDGTGYYNFYNAPGVVVSYIALA